MLLVKTCTGKSAIHGTGLFAQEKILKGEKVWEFSLAVDFAWKKEEVQLLPEPLRSDVLNLEHAYIEKYTGRYVLCGDDAKFINHSFSPTIADSDQTGSTCIAVRNIEIGEEITIDYRTFDDPITFEVRE